MNEIYVSTDIETDGPIPGDNAMLSLGSAAFKLSGELFDVFSANLIPIGSPDPKTAAWWETQPEAYAATKVNVINPRKAMRQYREWVESLPGKPVFVGYPAGFDFTFVYWYLIHFTGSSPFSFSAIDIKTYAMAKLGKPYRESTKKNWPKSWKKVGQRHSHVALDDAIEQGQQFIIMLNS